MSVTDRPSLDDESHLRIMRMLETNPSLTQRDLAHSLGVSVGKANYLLKALIDKGAVKASNFRRSDNKLAYAYLLTPAGVAQKAILTTKFLRVKLAEYESLRKEIEELKIEIQANHGDRHSSRRSAR